ncbi:ABC transporter ATP-binding protein [Brevibacterium sp. 50QC2O2]|jgi:iron complex transport system ATP-binding protein|uniref:ABC transporter ATP-binding protein n=1 Tax=unclassified Brevibacterium TaxID=2614124 RepID=UPI00211CF0D5|nr:MULTISPECIES: ABC transporter ATP-binding protein [unclassified Brevibacterium]MCQ9367263.1 ABC transporter ATP-binding protein [Brevibacterium sp. 91QC2O2]MCQ9389769.1 ABC transporter ATP-binding protein [Brevibacterium sp. 50QC2O2]
MNGEELRAPTGAPTGVATDEAAVTPAPALSARGVVWGSGGNRILHGIDLSARPGRMLGILGPNGAGKTSLLRILAGLRAPSAGIVELAGVPLAELSRRAVARRLAIVEQSPSAHLDVTVEQAVAIGRTPYRGAFSALTGYDSQVVEAALERVDLVGMRHRSWARLSGGEQQRVQVARALAQEPEVILLDEPTNHLDIRFQLEVLSLLRDSGLTVVTALHDLNLAARYCHDAIVLQDGRVRAVGTPERVLTTELIARVYGVQAVVEGSRHHAGVQISYLRAGRSVDRPPSPRGTSPS